jgi:hypothetical protein
VIRKVIAPFLKILSNASYEKTYAMGGPDLEGYAVALKAGLFELAVITL